MKKSKFLRNSKDMLSRSFNPSKCKMSLRLAGSRLKLLRNRKEVQVKQMKREIAQLLESGQDQTARIRVEHVIREEKMMSAYDLIEIYCELIVARLPIIESQKTCPIDLKEAIASVVFASLRCGDVPELTDVRKHFTDKYGKDFITAALEVRPDCGVSRMLVEKLSVVAPDGPTKIKILSAIAEEHNVKWDHKSFEENSVPASDLLNGPNTFQEERKDYVEQVPQSNYRMQGSPLNFTQVDNTTSLGPERLPSTNISGINTTSQHQTMRSGDERAQYYQGDRNTISLDRQRWNMEFKDATSAAQAAAESAELASMAARAAAELSSGGRINRQYSTESNYSDAYTLNNGGHEVYTNSKLSSGQYSEQSTNRSFSERTRSHNEQIDGMKPNNMKNDGKFKDTGHYGTKEYSQSASLKSKASTDIDSLDHGAPIIDGYTQKNTSKETSRDETSIQRQPFKYKAEIVNSWAEKSENVREERIEKQPNYRSSHSHSNISNDVNIFSNSEDQKLEYGGGVEDSFLSFEKKEIYGEAFQRDSSESAAVFFDKSDSDSESHGFDIGPTYDEPKKVSHLPLSGQKSHKHLSENTDSWSPTSSSSKTVKFSSSLFLTRKGSSSDSSERSVDGSKPNESKPVTFDESDGSTSDSDEDMRSRHSRISTDYLSKQNQSVGSWFKDESGPSVGSPLQKKESLGFDRKQWSPSFDGGEGMDRERYQEKELVVDPPARASQRKPSAESEDGLKFEKLTGGFRHKGYNQPPYLKNQFDESLSFDKESEETTATNSRSTAPPAVESPRVRTLLEPKKSRTPYLHYESESDFSEAEDSLRKSSEHKQERYVPNVKKNVKTKPSLAASNSIFGSDNSESDEDLPKESFNRTSHTRSGISRRTKAFPSSSEKINYSKTQQHRSELDYDDGMDRKATTSTIFAPRKRSEPQNSQERRESYSTESQHLQSVKGNSGQMGSPHRYNLGKASAPVIQESKITQKSSSVEVSSTPQRTTEASVTRLNKTSSNNDSSKQKASHVHPKLPDYDTLVQSLRKNRT